MRGPVGLCAPKILRQFAEPTTISNLSRNLSTRHGCMNKEERRDGDDRGLSDVDIFHPRSEDVEAASSSQE